MIHSLRSTYFRRAQEGNRKSAITNVNFIISELIEPVLSPDGEDLDIDYETTLIVTGLEGESLFAASVEAFSDANWVERLEACLDEDRHEGGWNSNLEFQ
jgi:hypothetical protein